MTLIATSHTAKRGRGEKSNHLMISFLYKPGYIYHILQNNDAHHLLKNVRSKEKVSFVITTFTIMGVITT